MLDHSSYSLKYLSSNGVVAGTGTGVGLGLVDGVEVDELPLIL